MGLAAGYRLPQRRGVISIEANNLLNTGFQFQDDSFRQFQDAATISPFIPERTVLLRVFLNL